VPIHVHEVYLIVVAALLSVCRKQLGAFFFSDRYTYACGGYFQLALDRETETCTQQGNNSGNLTTFSSRGLLLASGWKAIRCPIEQGLILHAAYSILACLCRVMNPSIHPSIHCYKRRRWGWGLLISRPVSSSNLEAILLHPTPVGSSAKS
jgi:hypothetical protein